MTRTPNWRSEPEQVWIPCLHISEVEPGDELLVQFKANGETYTAFVHKEFVDCDNKWLQGYIIADCGEDVLVGLPTETLTSGSRILVPNTEQESVLISAD